jgi:hypothetical protein
MIRRHRRPFSLSAALAAILILAAGCGDREPVGAELRTALRVGEVAHAISAPTAFGAGTYSRTLGPDGGVLHFGVGRLEFPAGALDRPTTITATVDGSTIGAVFSPHGLIFPPNAQPTLVFYINSTTSMDGSASILYVTPMNVVLEVLGGHFGSNGYSVEADVGHFSKFIFGAN